MLPVESLKHLQQMADAANPARRIVYCEREPKNVYYVEQPGGALERVRAQLPDANNAAADLDTLVRVAGAAGDDPPAQIWYSRAGVVAVLCPDAETATDRCTLALSPSPQMVKLAAWEREKGSLTQAELVILLRTLFAGCAPSGLLPAIRGVKVNKKADVESQIQQGKVSLGKSVVAEMTGAAGIPEDVIFDVPVFAQAAVPVLARVALAIDPDPQNERFNLYALPGQIEAANVHAEEVIAGRLADLIGNGTIPVYRGQP